MRGSRDDGCQDQGQPGAGRALAGSGASALFVWLVVGCGGAGGDGLSTWNVPDRGVDDGAPAAPSGRAGAGGRGGASAGKGGASASAGKGGAPGTGGDPSGPPGGAGGPASVCQETLPWDCNPLATGPCGAPGSACDRDDFGFTCFDPPNTLQVGAACSPAGPDFCRAGSTCDDGVCARFCCAAGDCDGAAVCTPVSFSSGVIGICRTATPGTGGAPGAAGAGGAGAPGTAGAAGSGGVGGGGGSPTAPVAYPSGPYGYSVGQVFPNKSIPAYRDGTGAWTTLPTSELYDPDGKKGIKAIYVPVFASWCSACKEESADLPSVHAIQKKKGVRFLALMVEGMNGPATKSSVDGWQASFHFPFDIGTSGDVGEAYFPWHILIDPRTMKVVPSCAAGTSMPCIDKLVAKNGP